MRPDEVVRPEIDTNHEDKNVMPSMVVRQQRNQLICANQGPAVDSSCEESTSSLLIMAAKRTNQPQKQQNQMFDQNGLIIPKRVLHHPVSVAQPIIRDLNRELKFNHIRGKNVLDQKSELKKALEKLEETKRRKEAEQERLSRRTSLEMRLEERAELIAKEAMSQAANSSTDTCNRPNNFSIESMR